ncbi:hypothetical protein ACFL2R_04095, partial [Patescibacteria group bacterium]
MPIVVNPIYPPSPVVGLLIRNISRITNIVTGKDMLKKVSDRYFLLKSKIPIIMNKAGISRANI